MNKLLHPVMRSIQASWAGKRNSGNFSADELKVVQELTKLNYIEITDDEKTNTFWVSLSESGYKKLLELNDRLLNP